MELANKSQENIKFMIDKILEKLKIINMDAISSGNYSEEQYEDLVDIYKHVMKKDRFSPSEMQAIAEALGSLRK